MTDKFDEMRDILNNSELSESINTEEAKIETKIKEKEVIKENHNYNITLIIIVLIISFSYLYIENRKINQKEIIRIQEQQELSYQKQQLDNCLIEAESSYSSNWDSQCKSIGRKKDCSLPSYRADQVEKWRENSREECMQKFKVKAF